jgi:uncharacterized caspase-like protein
MTLYQSLRLIVCAATLLALTMPSIADNRRVALVVGVSNYQVAPKLPNSVNDANAVGAALKRLGFSTEIVIDPDRRQFEDAVRRIGQTADAAEASVFYFAGHALEAAGQNLLLPVGANIKSARDLRYETIDLNAILESIAGRSRVSLLFLDSCRDNPFSSQLAGTTRSTSFRGLGAVDATVGTLIAFATAPGKVAEDGDQKNSPFTTALLKHLETPGIEVRRMLSEVRREVRLSTGGRQLPWENSALEGDFYFKPSETPAVRPTPAPPAPTPSATAAPVSAPTKLDANDLKRELLKQYAKAAPTRSVADNNAMIADYLAAVPNKAQAILPGTRNSWRVSTRETPEAAEQAALESCQLRYGKPCAVVAVNDAIVPPQSDGKYAVRDMPRLSYRGPFSPQMIPVANARTRLDQDVVQYAQAKGPKAVAIHPWGRLFVVTGSSSQSAAESAAMEKCEADPVRKGRDGPCHLYAAGDQVVLSVATSTKSDEDDLRKQLLKQFATAIPTRPVAERQTQVTEYMAGATHKAQALLPGTRGSWRAENRESPAAAEHAALEGCQLRTRKPCALAAVNDKIVASTAAGKFSPREMPRVGYRGLFNPQMIPAATAFTRSRSDVASYIDVKGPKAIALHPWGRIFVASGAATQAAAESAALDQCNKDPQRGGRDGPCYLYASGDEVVLPLQMSKASKSE